MNNRLFKHGTFDSDIAHSIYLALALALMLGGCTTTTAALYSGYEAASKVGIRDFNDRAIVTITDLTCALPYGALLRHPEMQPAAKSLCGGSSSVDLFQPVTLTTVTTTTSTTVK